MPYLLDDHPWVEEGYSLMKLATAYAGSAIQISRSSDGTTAEIGFVGDDLDTAAIEAFCAGTIGKVSKWYDQNEANGLEQTLGSQRPIIYENDAIVRDQQGNVSVRFANKTFLKTISKSSYRIGAGTASGFLAFISQESAGPDITDFRIGPEFRNVFRPNGAVMSVRTLNSVDIEPAFQAANGDYTFPGAQSIGHYQANSVLRLRVASAISQPASIEANLGRSRFVTVLNDAESGEPGEESYMNTLLLFPESAVTEAQFDAAYDDLSAAWTWIDGAGTVHNGSAPPPVVKDLDYAIATDTATATEGDSGTQTVTFTITRSGYIDASSAVDFAITGTATLNEDFTNIGGTSGASGLTGTAAFAASETTKTISIDVSGDADFESDETIVVTLSNGTAPGGTPAISTASATTTITNDDAAPPTNIDYAVAASTATLTEGNSGTQALTFTVTRTGAVQDASAIDYAIGGTATHTEDFSNIGGTGGASALTGTIAFASSETAKTITLDVLGDADFESDETISVTISSGTAPNGTATISAATATTTITNDDAPPPVDIDYAVSASTPTLAEMETGTQLLAFTVTRSNTEDASQVDFAISGTATFGEDYDSIGGTSGATA
ncbi:MAG: Calx-beta domain-containing protein, partial [Cyanobacteria bacterium P01_E01_bin.48]